MTQKEKDTIRDGWLCIQGVMHWSDLAKRKKKSYIGMKLHWISLVTKEFKQQEDE